MIANYATVLLSGVRNNLHVDCIDYRLEVPLTKDLGQWMSNRGWRSHTDRLTYPNTTRRADLRSYSPDETISVTLEFKQYVRDYPSRPKPHLEPNRRISHQHLGILPGKTINAVDDVRKLEQAASSHVAFLLVRMERRDSPGRADMTKFVRLAGLQRRVWTKFEEDWIHPSNVDHHVYCHLWCRSI
jgi:hypothetical protein